MEEANRELEDLKREATLAWVDHLFTYHPPRAGQVERYEEMRKVAREWAHFIIDNCPEGPERTLALRKLQEVVFWANAAIAIGEAPRPEGLQRP